ncbi:nucleotide exchange factor GrpE [Nocardioides gansuensis]|uniref:Protein GrpE n=1 Tax=Nocardioides gansuensis TaxID=2138300 RepID=A0A2T8FF98_9ACTN|nr:nucleotide exchange factor GrpE [Nocardioides gansuensis]PVG84360.1 nucleotide exchange factor GrpE [Nocardioides gansuensis]
MTDPTDPVEPTAGVQTDGQLPEETTPDQGSSPSGEARAEAGSGGPSEAETVEADPLADAQRALADRTADLQRLQAEYVNYKRRVDRDRELVRENATFAVLSPIIEVLDTIDRAREHGELEGGFKAVAEQLERIVAGLGLTRFGQPGDAFDPTVHEALSHIGTDPEVTVTTCQHIAKAGYKIGDRVVRAAQVLVVDPAEPESAGSETAQPEPAEAETAGPESTG